MLTQKGKLWVKGEGGWWTQGSLLCTARAQQAVQQQQQFSVCYNLPVIRSQVVIRIIRDSDNPLSPSIVRKGVLARSCTAKFNSRTFTQPADLTGIKLQILWGRLKEEEKKNKRDSFPKNKPNNYPSRAWSHVCTGEASNANHLLKTYKGFRH